MGAVHSAPLECSIKFMELFESLPVKISQHEQLANKGCMQARDDWRRHFGTVRGFVFYLGKYNAIAVAVPDCLPERIEAVAYASEIAFLYDDMFDSASRKVGGVSKEDMIDALSATLDTGVYAKPSNTGIHQVQARIMMDMMSIDKVRARVFFDNWAKLVKVQSDTQDSKMFKFKTVDEYLTGQIIDARKNFWNGIIIFGMALTISDGEMRLVREIAELAYTTLILSNDYFSWQKEYNDFCRHRSSGSMANAIWVIMNEYSVDVDEAKSMCIEKIKASCQTFCEKKKQLSAKFYLKLSEDLFKYL